MSYLSFSAEDLALFADASHDRNPLHLSPEYAHKTAYGEPVVYGVLAGLAGLAHLRPRPDWLLTNLVLEFLNPLFCNVDYRLTTADREPGQAKFTISDGSRVMLKGEARFKPGHGSAEIGRTNEIKDRPEAADLGPADLVPGAQVWGEYALNGERAFRLIERLGPELYGIGATALSAILWSSYLVGMQLPGRRALFARVALEIAPSPSSDPRFEYQASVSSYDSRFGLARLEGQLSQPGGGARLKASAFIRSDSSSTVTEEKENGRLSGDALKGRVGLVIGASRGLGAAITRGLAQQGCTVLANYWRSHAEARRLEVSLAQAGGHVELAPGDARDQEWTDEIRERIVRDYGRLDFLICSAFPAIQPLRLESAAISRINAYISRSLSLVSVPLAALLPLLAEQAGWSVTISSKAVENPPAEWPHYIAAKYAVEGLVHAAAVEYQTVHFLIVRPPKLLTALTDTPLGRQGAVPPESIADAIIRQLQGATIQARVQVLDEQGIYEA